MHKTIFLFSAILYLAGVANPARGVGPENLALKKPATSSSIENDEHAAARANDGDPDTFWTADDEPEGAAEWWQVDLEKTCELASCQVRWPYDGKRYRYKIEGSTDGKKWSILSDQSQNDLTSQVHEITLRKGSRARYLKIAITAVDEGCWPGISEVKVFGNSSPTGAPR